MKSRSIFTLENENGQTPYEANSSLYEEQESTILKSMLSSHNKTRPMIHSETDWDNPNSVNQIEKMLKLRKFGEVRRHAFKSVSQLHGWYKGWLDFLFSIGFEIKEKNIEDKNIIFSKNQLAYLDETYQKNHKSVFKHKKYK